jgi:hypothetical protein
VAILRIQEATVMSTTTFYEESKVEWKADDPRLLRAAKRIIRLYDLTEMEVCCVKPESLAKVIAHELNQDPPAERNE